MFVLFRLAYAAANVAWRGTGLIPLCKENLIFMLRDQLDGIADLYLASLDHVTIQREHPIKFLHDVREHLTILLQAVRVKRRHDATPTKVLDPDEDASSNAQTLTGPQALCQALDTADYKVRSEPPAVMPKGRNGSIRGYQQGKHVKPTDRLIANQPGARPNDAHNILPDLGIAPYHAVNYRLTGRIEPGMVTEKSMVRSSRDRATKRVLHMDDAIPLDTKSS